MTIAQSFMAGARPRLGSGLFSMLRLRAAAHFCAGAKEPPWKVSKGSSSVYVLGSIHYLRSENYPLKKAILDAFETSKRLVLEIDLNATSGQAAQRLMLEKALFRDGTSLPQNISAETYQL